MLVLSAAVSLLIRSGCVISATLYLILFIGDRKKEYLYIALFMLSQYLIELMVRGYETSSPIYYYLGARGDQVASLLRIRLSGMLFVQEGY